MTSFRKPHPVWAATQCDTRDVTKARLKAKLLTGTYMLQSKRAKFNKTEVDPTCKLCHSQPEDTEHFLLTCPALEGVRRGYLEAISSLLQQIPGPPTDITPHLILDTAATVSLSPSHLVLVHLESATRHLCFALHQTRTQLLNSSAKVDVAPTNRGGIYK